MRTWMMGLPAMVLSLVVTGCDNFLCNDLSEALDDYDDRARPCVQAGVEQPRFSARECDETRCSTEEQRVLEDFGRCLQDLPECDPDSPAAFESALEACAVAADTNLSSACGDPALGLD